MLRVLLILIPLALAVYALVDCISSKDEEIRHLPKLMWILLIVLATVVGPLAWLFVGRDKAARAGGGRGGGRGRGGWVAPDDNPEFLRSLEPRESGGAGGAGSAGGESAGEKDEKDKTADELLKDWEADQRRREEELRRQDGGEDGPGPDDGPRPGPPS
jgi:phospholipase D-like protein